MKSYKPKACVRFGEEFTPRSGYAKYCDACRKIAHNEWNKAYYRAHLDYYKELRDRRKLELIREILSTAKELANREVVQT